MTAAQTGTLYVALELGQDKWHLACATQAAEKPRFRALPARDLSRLADEIRKAKERFRLPPTPRSGPATRPGGTASGSTGP